MSQTVNTGAKSNPLQNWYRQPKIFINLPSKGKFYDEGSLDKSENNEYAVYAMTAKDELLLKTPDALMTGASTVEVIKSCIPAILDPWKMPSIDLDFALIAIRIATYGDKMDVGATCPHCSEANDYTIDLNAWVQMFGNYHFSEVVLVDPLEVHIRPFSYREITKASIKTIEQQKIFAVINNDELSDQEKIDKFGESFVKITDLTVSIVADSIAKIVTPDGESTDKAQIKEFINNCSKDVFAKVSAHVTELKSQIDLTIPDATCTSCEKKFDLPVTMDQANFFVVKSQA